uniref:Uncharacterized protein n=1 Tax=Opuntia streptacantha TaxID=393608 RepID=A0A7C9A5R0_OPUST
MQSIIQRTITHLVTSSSTFKTSIVTSSTSSMMHPIAPIYYHFPRRTFSISQTMVFIFFSFINTIRLIPIKSPLLSIMIDILRIINLVTPPAIIRMVRLNTTISS